jgi:hypothetical protein
VALRQDPRELAAAQGGALRRSDPNGTGIRRRRRGRGFSYLGTDGAVVTDLRTLARIRRPGDVASRQFLCFNAVLRHARPGQRPSARASWAFFMDERPLMFRLRASA